MEAITAHFIREETILPSSIIKRVIEEGTGDLISPNTKIEMLLETYQDDGTLISSETSIHTIINYAEGADKSSIDYALLSMKLNEIAYIKVSAGRHIVKGNSWDDIWYKINPHKIESNIDIILPDSLSMIRQEEIITEDNFKIIKKVIREGFDNLPTPESKISFNIEFRHMDGTLAEPLSTKSIILTKIFNPGVHKGVQLALKTMKCSEEAWVFIPENWHYVDSAADKPVWAYIFVTEIIINSNILFPQNEPFLREEVLTSDNGVVKRVVKEGEGELIPNNAKIWLKYEGRTEDGFEFQKPNEFVIGNDKIYSEAWHLALESMKRGEVAWIKATKGHHIIGDYMNETLWFKFFLEEFLVIKEINPNAPLPEKLEAASEIMNDGNRLYSTKKYADCRTLYNKAHQLLTLRKGAFETMEDNELKKQYIAVRTRACLNCSQIFIINAEQANGLKKRIEYLDKVLEKCNEVIGYDNKNIKANYRKAIAYKMKDEIPKAIEIVEFLLTIQPNNKEISTLYSELVRKGGSIKAKEKLMCKGIFDRLENEIQKEDEEEKKIKERKKAEKILESQEEVKRKREIREAAEEENRKKESIKKLRDQLEKGFIVDTMDPEDENADFLLGQDEIGSEGENSN